MNFVSYTNNVKLEDIDLLKQTITIYFSNMYITYAYKGSVNFFKDTDDLVGAYVDSNHNIKLVFNPEHSDDNIDDNTLSALEYNREFVIEHIVQQIYIKEMGK